MASLTGTGGAATPPPAPVRPSAPVLEALIFAAALPGLGSVRLRQAVEAGGAGPLRELARQEATRLRSADRERARGWALRALATIRSDRLHVLLPGMDAYPPALLRVDPAPCPLFARGRLGSLGTPMVAVVGTRRATRYGREAAHRIAAELAAAGVTVVSGLAAGIDGTAHRAAGAGRTVAVVGSGLDVFYPREHRDLQRTIGREGLLLSEQLPGAPPAASSGCAPPFPAGSLRRRPQARLTRDRPAPGGRTRETTDVPVPGRRRNRRRQTG